MSDKVYSQPYKIMINLIAGFLRDKIQTQVHDRDRIYSSSDTPVELYLPSLSPADRVWTGFITEECHLGQDYFRAPFPAVLSCGFVHSSDSCQRFRCVSICVCCWWITLRRLACLSAVDTLLSHGQEASRSNHLLEITSGVF